MTKMRECPLTVGAKQMATGCTTRQSAFWPLSSRYADIGLLGPNSSYYHLCWAKHPSSFLNRRPQPKPRFLSVRFLLFCFAPTNTTILLPRTGEVCLGEVYYPHQPRHYSPAPTSTQGQIHRCYFAPTDITITLPYLPVGATNQTPSDDPRPPPCPYQRGPLR